MKRFLFTGLLSLAVLAITAQMQTPQPSPFSKMEQKVGLTTVEVAYSRPSMKGRTIFGDLVPYDQLWRTGANKNTIVTFSDDVKIGGKEVAAGSYALYTKPGESVWEITFYSDTENWGTPQNWDASKVAAIVKTEVIKMPMNVETFTITIDDLTNNGAMLGLLWEDVYVGIPFEVPTAEKAKKSIEMTMAGPSGRDYYMAASYYFDEGVDMQKTKEWIDKAMSMIDTPRFWQLRQQSLIYAKAGDKMGAIKAAKKSLELATEAGNADYIKMNTDSLKEWGGM